MLSHRQDMAGVALLVGQQRISASPVVRRTAPDDQFHLEAIALDVMGQQSAPCSPLDEEFTETELFGFDVDAALEQLLDVAWDNEPLRASPPAFPPIAVQTTPPVAHVVWPRPTTPEQNKKRAGVPVGVKPPKRACAPSKAGELGPACLPPLSRAHREPSAVVQPPSASPAMRTLLQVEELRKTLAYMRQRQDQQQAQQAMREAQRRGAFPPA
jgi:hypothetical protein